MQRQLNFRHGSRALLGAVVCLCGLVWRLNADEPRTVPPAFLVSTAFDSPASTTRGIQEAIDALPDGGGAVYVPPGEYVVERTIVMRNGTQLIGAGRNAVLRKAPLLIEFLAEDVRKDSNQDYVVVRDAARFRPGMAVYVADTRNEIEGRLPWLITAIEGKKIYLEYVRAGQKVKFKPTADLLVERRAALLTAFWVIHAGADCLIENLAVDGNRANQQIDGAIVYMDKPYKRVWWTLRNIKNVGRGCAVRRCWVYDAGQVNISCSSGRALITDCEILGAWQGVHPGAGPLVKIVNNIIHSHSQSGIYMCMGNYGCIIAQNHIYNNKYGIWGLGCRVYENAGGYEHKRYLARDGDHHHIITQNQIFDNWRAGIASHQGRLGPTDYVITDNVVKNNNLDGVWPLNKSQLPGGMAFYNARNCVIANNRCYDDQDEFGCGELLADAPAGSRTLTIKLYDARPISNAPWQDPPDMQKFRLALFNGTDGEEVNVVRREYTARGIVMHLDAPLRFAYPQGCDPRILKSQQWGIILAGPESRGNVVTGNQCSENLLGGILAHNENGAMGLNVGGETKIDPARSFLQNLYPAVGAVGPVNGGFEADDGWELKDGASLVAGGYRGGRSLQIAPAKNVALCLAQSDLFALKPQTRYRLSGWVRIADDYRDSDGRLKQPELTLVIENDLAQASPAFGGTHGFSVDRDELKAEVWQLYEGEFVTGVEPRQGRVLCRLQDPVGTVWFDDVLVEEIKPYALRPFAEVSVE